MFNKYLLRFHVGSHVHWDMIGLWYILALVEIVYVAQ